MKMPYTRAGRCGNTVWQRARYGQICYPYHIPANPRTAAQQRVRNSFGAVSARWRTLSEEQREAWCATARRQRTRKRLGRSWPLNGFNYFVRVNTNLVNLGMAQVDLPPVQPHPPGGAAALRTEWLNHARASVPFMPRFVEPGGTDDG